jgi:hypothetical protein
MTALIGFPLGTVYNIVNVTNAYPGVVTLSSIADPNSFAVSIGQTVTISKVVGMFQLNDVRFNVAALDPVAFTFQLYDLQFNPVDTRSFSPYVGGGEINIVSYPAGAGQPPGLMYNNQ